MIKLIVFLGNPGKQYENTRHNIGFIFCDYKYKNISFQKKFNALFSNSLEYKLLKPQTFMNNSGEAVQKALSFFSLKADELLIIHDDLELAFGEIKIQKGGGLKGHNGLKSISNILKNDNFYRLRFGIGRPQHNNVAAYVLSNFSSDESAILPIYLENAANQLDEFLKQYDK